jgi:hypothetical protein
MADQGRWFKLWCSALTDDDLGNLDISDFGRWAKLGAHVKEHGSDGALRLAAPCRHLCELLQLPDYDALIACIDRLPGVQIGDPSHVTNTTVTFANWRKYQCDRSAFRMRRHRLRDGIKKRGEEKRREEKRDPPNPPVSDGFEIFWSLCPKKREKPTAQAAFKVARKKADLDTILRALRADIASQDWKAEGGKFIPYPAKWLKRERWADEHGSPANRFRPADGDDKPDPRYQKALDDYRKREGLPLLPPKSEPEDPA